MQLEVQFLSFFIIIIIFNLFEKHGDFPTTSRPKMTEN